jgi:hypothetical protein
VLLVALLVSLSVACIVYCSYTWSTSWEAPNSGQGYIETLNAKNAVALTYDTQHAFYNRANVKVKVKVCAPCESPQREHRINFTQSQPRY